MTITVSSLKYSLLCIPQRKKFEVFKILNEGERNNPKHL